MNYKIDNLGRVQIRSGILGIKKIPQYYYYVIPEYNTEGTFRIEGVSESVYALSFEMFTWLNENIGPNRNHFRKFDVPFYERQKHLDKITSNNYDEINPPLERGNEWWAFTGGESIILSSEAAYSLFRLAHE